MLLLNRFIFEKGKKLIKLLVIVFNFKKETIFYITIENRVLLSFKVDPFRPILEVNDMSSVFSKQLVSALIDIKGARG